MTGPRPEHVAADDRGELDRPDDAGRQPGDRGFEERRPEQVPAELERIGDGDDDPLAVAEQVRQVVGDEVADRDRKQARPERRQTDEPPDEEDDPDDRPKEGEQDDRPWADGWRPEDVEEGLRLGQAVEDDRARPERDEHDERDRPGEAHEPRAERLATDAPPVGVAGVDRPRREPSDGPEPDREGLALAPPRVAAELGHRDERDRGVADEDRAERRPAAGPAHDQLEPDEERRIRRPPARHRVETGTWRRSQPRKPTARIAAAPRSWSVANGSSHVQAGPMNAETIARPTQP